MKIAGQVVVYGSQGAIVEKAVKSGFEAKYPDVKLEFQNPGGTESILKKLDAEKGSPKADLMMGGSSLEYAEAKSMGLLERTDPSVVAAGIPETIQLGGASVPTRDKEGAYYAWGYSIGGIGYNLDRVRDLKLPLPESYADLAKPIYKGQVVNALPQKSSGAFSTVVATYQVYGAEKVWDLWDKLDANTLFYTASSAQIYAMLGKGEVAFNIGVNGPIWRNRAEGEKVDFIFPKDGALIFDSSLGLVKNGPNRAAAEALLTWLLSPEGQVVAAGAFYVPPRPNTQAKDPETSLEAVSKRLTKAVPLDSAFASLKRDEIMKKFEDYGRSKTK